MRLLAFGAATILAGLPVGAAHADSNPGVLLNRDITVVPLDYGHIIQVVCNATADPGTTQQVPVATAVSCSLGGVVESQAQPGSEAIVSHQTAATGPVEFCIWGEAGFADPITGVVITVERDPVCETLSY